MTALQELHEIQQTMCARYLKTDSCTDCPFRIDGACRVNAEILREMAKENQTTEQQRIIA